MANTQTYTRTAIYENMRKEQAYAALTEWYEHLDLIKKHIKSETPPHHMHVICGVNAPFIHFKGLKYLKKEIILDVFDVNGGVRLDIKLDVKAYDHALGRHLHQKHAESLLKDIQSCLEDTVNDS